MEQRVGIARGVEPVVSSPCVRVWGIRPELEACGARLRVQSEID
jgi:hypothetical protein